MREQSTNSRRTTGDTVPTNQPTTITIYRDNREDQREEWDTAVTADVFWRTEYATYEWPIERRVSAYLATVGVVEDNDHFNRLVDAVLAARPTDK